MEKDNFCPTNFFANRPTDRNNNNVSISMCYLFYLLFLCNYSWNLFAEWKCFQHTIFYHCSLQSVKVWNVTVVITFKHLSHTLVFWRTKIINHSLIVVQCWVSDLNLRTESLVVRESFRSILSQINWFIEKFQFKTIV